MSQEVFNSDPPESVGPEQIAITAESLWNDNHSGRAESLREQFSEAEKRGELNVVHRCSDSRYILDPIYIGIPTISVGGKKTDNSGIYNDPGTKNIIVLPHDPCGGLSAREEQAKNGAPEVAEDIAKYVKEDIRHHDPLIQGIREARDISRLTNKDVFVAVHTQENGVNNPLPVTYRHGKRIYSGSSNPTELEDFLRRNEVHVAQIASEFPYLKDLQQTQNPELLVISRNRRSAESEFPETTRRPGSTFRIFVPMPEDTVIAPSEAGRVIDQAHYPVGNFINLSKVLIETDSMDASNWLLEQIMKRNWMKEWSQNPEHRIFIAASTEGKLLDIYAVV
jgi:hypothetical protein